MSAAARAFVEGAGLRCTDAAVSPFLTPLCNRFEGQAVTLLFSAIENGNIEIVMKLISAGADVNATVT